MAYRGLADLIVVFHLAFIVFAVLGGLLTLRWRWAPCVHLPAAFWGVFIELSGGVCPLTPLESYFRRAAGAFEYSDGFIEHYLLPVIYPAGLTQDMQLTLACVVVVANAFVYWVVRRHRVVCQNSAERKARKYG